MRFLHTWDKSRVGKSLGKPVSSLTFCLRKAGQVGVQLASLTDRCCIQQGPDPQLLVRCRLFLQSQAVLKALAGVAHSLRSSAHLVGRWLASNTGKLLAESPKGRLQETQLRWKALRSFWAKACLQHALPLRDAAGSSQSCRGRLDVRLRLALCVDGAQVFRLRAAEAVWSRMAPRYARLGSGQALTLGEALLTPELTLAGLPAEGGWTRKRTLECHTAQAALLVARRSGRRRMLSCEDEAMASSLPPVCAKRKGVQATSLRSLCNQFQVSVQCSTTFGFPCSPIPSYPVQI